MINPILEERFEYKGFICVVLFQGSGHRCGYVGIPKTNEYYNVDYNEIPVSCHGGLTYSRSYLALNDDSDIWWIGFDCAHWNDAKDYMSARKYFADDEEALKIINLLETSDMRYPTGGTVRDLSYCKNECIGIVNQLLEESEEQCNTK